MDIKGFILLFLSIVTLSCSGTEINKIYWSNREKANTEFKEDEGNKKMKALNELINKEDPGFNILKGWLKDAKNRVEILPRNLQDAEQALYNTQVSTRSLLGSIIYDTGGILIEEGWLRILGSGHPKLNRTLPEWNKGKSFTQYGEQPSFLLIADDVTGGFFAINGGGLSGNDIGKIFYFAPDTLEWESTGKSYSEFIYWCLNGDLYLYYENFFENNCKEDLRKISGTEAFSFVPFLFAKEGKDIKNVDRSIVPVAEIWELYMNIGK